MGHGSDWNIFPRLKIVIKELTLSRVVWSMDPLKNSAQSAQIGPPRGGVLSLESITNNICVVNKSGTPGVKRRFSTLRALFVASKLGRLCFERSSITLPIISLGCVTTFAGKNLIRETITHRMTSERVSDLRWPRAYTNACPNSFSGREGGVRSPVTLSYPGRSGLATVRGACSKRVNVSLMAINGRLAMSWDYEKKKKKLSLSCGTLCRAELKEFGIPTRQNEAQKHFFFLHVCWSLRSA